jgi:hypothetical protein
LAGGRCTFIFSSSGSAKKSIARWRVVADEFGRDAVPGHHEEAGVPAGCVDLARHLVLRCVAAGSQRRQVDCGDRIFRRHGAPFPRVPGKSSLDYSSADACRNGTRTQAIHSGNLAGIFHDAPHRSP